MLLKFWYRHKVENKLGRVSEGNILDYASKQMSHESGGRKNTCIFINFRLRNYYDSGLFFIFLYLWIGNFTDETLTKVIL